MEEATPTTEIWPDNALAVEVFLALSTQWRVGMAGAVGLDYNAIPFVMRTLGIPHAQRPGVFESLRIMEDAALATMRETRSKT